MKKVKPIKPFKNLDDEAEFWDTHDTSEIFKNPKVSLSRLTKLKKEDNSNPKFAF